MTWLEISKLAANFAELITAVALILAGGWSLIGYLRAKRIDAAKWLHELGQDFQFSDDLEKGKFLLDFKYPEEVEPLLSSLIFHCNTGLTDEQLRVTVELDKVLNHFEHLLFLQSNNHITKKDRDVYFGYWFGLLKEPNRGVLRRYCENFGYNQLARGFYPKDHKVQKDEYLLVYGTLWKGEDNYLRLGMDKQCEFIKDTTIKGSLYDLGDYPGLVLEQDMSDEGAQKATDIPVQLFRVIKNNDSQTPLKILAEIDKYEECNVLDPAASEYRRTTLPVSVGGKGLKVDAWIYLYQKDTKGKELIGNQSWIRYLRNRRIKQTH